MGHNRGGNGRRENGTPTLEELAARVDELTARLEQQGPRTEPQPANGPAAKRKPVAPYLAVGLSTVVYGVAERKHISWNLETIEDGIHAAMSVIGINMPIRLVALAEGALTGFTDEAFDIPHVVAAHDLFIDIPGEETEQLGRARAALRHLHRRAVQGALARGDARPVTSTRCS